MPESSSFRTPFRNHGVHGSETLRISALRDFYPNFRLIQDKIEFGNISFSQIRVLRTVS